MNKKANTKLPLCEGSRKGLGHTLGPKKKNLMIGNNSVKFSRN